MLRRRNVLLAATLAAACASCVNAQGTLQQQFDQASKAFDAGNWRLAADIFSALRGKLEPNSRSAAIADIREGYSQFRLGDPQLAISLLESGLGQLPDDPVLAPDRLLAVQGLANGYETSNDVLLSAPYYREQVRLASDNATKMAGYAGLARTVMFEDANEAIQAAGALYGMAGQPNERAVALDLMGRALLEAGRRAEAIESFRRAVSAAGGLTQRIDQLDDAIRADMALAGLLSGNEKLAHLYLSATGTAQDQSSFLPVPRELGARRCPKGATPENVAVVEFGISRDGHAKDARPVYATGGGEFAGIMARYVNDFEWDPARIAGLHPLQASMARLEVHCFNDDRPVADLLDSVDPLPRWLSSIGLSAYEPQGSSQAAKLAAANNELRNRERLFGQNSAQLLPVLHAIEKLPVTGTGDSLRLLTRQIQIAKAAKAPPSVLARLDAYRITAGISDDDILIARLKPLAADPIYKQDPQASGFLNLLIGRLLSRGGRPADQIRELADTESLPLSDPIRRAANLFLAEDDFSRHSEARKRHILASGLTINPCDAAEVHRKTEASSRGYPELTRHWGFEGWTFLQFDIAPDGQPRNVVATIAYPPLIFTPASKETALQMRYDAKGALVPGNGCTNYSTSVRFRLTQ